MVSKPTCSATVPTRREGVGQGRAAAGPGEPAEVEGEAKGHGVLLLERAASGAQERPGDELDGGVGVDGMHAVEPLGGEGGDGDGQRLQLDGQHRRGHRPGPLAVAVPGEALADVEDDGVDRHAALGGPGSPTERGAWRRGRWCRGRW